MNRKTATSLFQSALMAALIFSAPIAVHAATTSNTYLNDSDITLKVKSTVEPYKDIKIISDEGRVTVTGTVASQQEKDQIINDIRKVSGVKSVDDKLSVKRASDSTGSVGGYIDDAAITTVVKSKFLGQKGLDSLDISVKTNQGVVTLNGEVENASQIGLAENVAMEADGVRSVVNKLTLKP